MPFQQIVFLDKTELSQESKDTLQTLSSKQIREYTTNPLDQEEIITRIADADTLFLGLHSKINRKVIETCPQLQAIFICGTNSKHIHLDACAENNIHVSNIRDYSEEGVVERVIYELITLRRGRGTYQWRETPSELHGKIMWVIGMGAIGKLLTRTMLWLGMQVLYHSRTRKENIEKQWGVFVSKKELLTRSDIISLQTPRDIIILEKEDFAIMKEKVLINNTLGKAFHETDLRERIAKENNYLIQDNCSDFADSFQNIERVIDRPFIAGKTQEFIDRLNQKVLDNVQSYLQGSPNILYKN